MGHPFKAITLNSLESELKMPNLPVK